MVVEPEEVSASDIKKVTSASLSSEDDNTPKSNVEKDASPDFLARLSKKLDNTSRTLFFRLGYWIGKRPFLTIALSFIGVAIASLGLFNYENNDGRGQRIWVPIGTSSGDNLDTRDEYFDESFRISQVILTGKDDADIATQEGVLELISILEVIEETSWEGNGYYDLCNTAAYGDITYCVVNSVLNVFFDEEYVVYADDGTNVSFSRTTRAKVSTLTDEEIKTAIFDSAITWTNDPFTTDLFVGELSSSNGFSERYTPAFRMNFLINGSGSDSTGSKQYEFEKVVEKNVLDLNDQLSSTAYVNILAAQQDSGADQAEDVPLLLFGIMLAIIYVCMTMGHLNSVDSRVGLAIAAVVGILLAYVAMIGVCSLISWYGPVHQLLPLLLVAIGIDDAYVIVTAFDETSDISDTPERIGRALSRAGAAITVTSCTNSFAFLMGGTTQIPAMRWFAIWAGVGIFLDFLLQATFFVACLTIDSRRQKNDRRDLFCCSVVENRSTKNIFGFENYGLKRFFKNTFAPILLKKVTAFVVIGLTFALFGISISGTVSLELAFTDDALYQDGSPIAEYWDVQEVYFVETSNIFPVEVFTGQLDYANENNQRMMTILFESDPEIGAISSDPFYKQNTLNSWYSLFREWGNLTDPTDVFPYDSYYEELSKFLLTEVGISIKDSLAVGEDQKLVATLSYLAIDTSNADLDNRIDAKNSLEESIDGAGVPNSFPVSRVFLWFERDAILYQEALQILLVALAVVFVVTFLMIGNIRASVITLLGPCFSVIDMLGLMYYFSIDFNTVTIICLALSVGLTIDFSSHITIGFMSSVGSRYERVCGGLTHLGPPLTHAGITTFIATGILVFSTTYVFKLFFKMFMMIIAFGMFHGLVLVPVVLWKLGPDGFFERDGDFKEEEDKIVSYYK